MSAHDSTSEAPASAAPELALGFAVWSRDWGAVRAAFVGRGASAERHAALAAACRGDERPRLAWPRQVHSARVLAARAGECDEGDALVGDAPGLALAVASADCVPVLVAGERRLTAIHAGWRGLVAGILARAVAAIDEPPGALRVAIGPAIGPCCYEVGEEVAAAVAAASDPAIVVRDRGAKPHLDLQEAARLQLLHLGVAAEVVRRCTRCHPRELWSYRRDGPAAGRNFAFVWRREAAPPSGG